VILVKGSAAALSSGAVAASGVSAFVHSAPVRLPLMIFAALVAVINLYVTWRTWRIRNSPAAQWRRRPLARKEKLRIALVLTSSVMTLFILAAEVYSHQILHPGEL
jgi:hypothetical protein